MVIFIAFLLACVVTSVIACAVKAKPRQRKQTLTEREQFLIEWKLAQEKAKQETARINAVIREQERLAKEQERQAAQLEKHEEQINKLQFQVSKATADIEHLNIVLDDLRESFELACRMADKAHNAGDEKREEQAKNKIITLRNRIHTMEQKLNKAKFDRDQASRKLTA